MLQKRKPNHGFFLMMLPVSLYIGYCLGNGNWQAVTIETLSDCLKYFLTHPLPFHFTEQTAQGCVAGGVIWGIAYLSHISSIRNFMPGKEYGTARVAQPAELNRKLQDKDPANNKILSEHLRISFDTRLTGINNNTIVIGGSGSGKSLRMVKPNAYNCGTQSYIFCDPKGELLRDTGNYLEAHGYRIVVLNLVDMESSDCYNPFEYIRKDEDIIKLINNLMANTTPKDVTKGDPFWDRSEGMLLQALMYYVWYEYPKQGKAANFRGLLELLNKAQVQDNPKEPSELDRLMFRLPENHPALITYKKVKSGAADTIRSIIITANSRLSYLQNPNILRILDKDEIQIPFLGEGVYENPERKTALFCVIPDNDKSYNFVVGLLYTQIFQELYYIADHKYGGRLPVPVSLWMDEFSNVALPDSFCELLSTMRSRDISCNIIIQNLAQIKALFKDTWETIPGNCDSFVFLGGNEQSTFKYVSEMLGKVTIDKKSTGETKGSHGSSSSNCDVLGRDMMAPDEVRKLDNQKCVVLVRGFDPVIDEKYRMLEKDVFKESCSMGAYCHHREREDLYETGRLAFFLDGKGTKTREESYRMQVELYKGIFAESEIGEELQELNEKYLYLPDSYHGYVAEEREALPVFFKEVEAVKSGSSVLHKHWLSGYCLDGEFYAVENSDRDTIFCEGNRVTVLMRAMM